MDAVALATIVTQLLSTSGVKLPDLLGNLTGAGAPTPALTPASAVGGGATMTPDLKAKFSALCQMSLDLYDGLRDLAKAIAPAAPPSTGGSSGSGASALPGALGGLLGLFGLGGDQAGIVGQLYGNPTSEDIEASAALLPAEDAKQLRILYAAHSNVWNLGKHNLHTCPILGWSPMMASTEGKPLDRAFGQLKFFRAKHDAEDHCDCKAKLGA